MSEYQKNWFMVAWPIILFFTSTLYSAGSTDQEIQQIAKDQQDLKPLVAKVAVLESNADQVKEDVQEIKADVKAIRNVLLSGGKQDNK
jgi:outer membrane murein-binding lipoprotein Lpp